MVKSRRNVAGKFINILSWKCVQENKEKKQQQIQHAKEREQMDKEKRKKENNSKVTTWSNGYSYKIYIHKTY